MDEFSGVVFYMHMMDSKCPYISLDHSSNRSGSRDRMIELCYLVPHGEIRIEITFSIKYTPFMYATWKCVTRTNCEINDSLRKSWQHSRKSHTDGTCMHIWFWCEFDGIRTRTKHFCLRFNTYVCLEAHDDFVFRVHVKNKLSQLYRKMKKCQIFKKKLSTMISQLITNSLSRISWWDRRWVMRPRGLFTPARDA